MGIEEWVHLVGDVVKLYDQYDNFNGELKKKTIFSIEDTQRDK